MEQARKDRRPRVGAIMVLAGLLASMLAVVAVPPARAEPLNPGTLGNFVNEGDQDDPTLNTGTIDWETVKTDPRVTEWELIHDDLDVDTNDHTFLDSSKEQDPSTWGCAAAESPPKDDIFRIYLASQISSAGQFLHIGYVRKKATGDTDINIEFNRISGDFSCPGNEGRVRSLDDLMISFTFPGGNDPSVINIFRWDPTADAAPAATGSDFLPADGHWDLVALAPNQANGADNSAFEDPLKTDKFFDGGALEPRAFGELTLDLGSIFGAGLLDCPGIGFVTGHSRASHSFSSDLKDVFPERSFDLSDCAKIRVKKVDNSEPAAPRTGAVFGLYDTLEKATAVAGQSDQDAIDAAVSTCTTEGVDATCLLTHADPDESYWIAEITPPDGLLPSSEEPRPVLAADLVPFGTLDLTDEPFVNDKIEGPDLGVVKLAANGTHEDSIVAPGTATYSIVVTNHGQGDAPNAKVDDELPAGAWTVTLAEADADEDDVCPILPDTEEVTEGSFTCTFGTLVPGESKTITVTREVGVEECPTDLVNTARVSTTSREQVPALVAAEEQGLDPNGDNDTSTATIHVLCPPPPPPPPPNNPPPPAPIGIDLDKTGDTIAHVGDTVDYEFTVTNTGDVALVNVELTDPECNAGTINQVDDGDGDATLAVDEVWRYTCQRTITADDVVVVDGEDFAFNTGTVTARDANGRTTDDTDPHQLEIITPAIEIVKTVDDDTPAVGQTVTFTYVVTNTGDTTLFGVDVVDDQLGPIGTIDELAPGESATLTTTMEVAGDSPVRNVATADGEDVLGKHVDDDDDAEIAIVLGAVIVAPQPQALPVTGADIDRLMALAELLLALGVAFTIAGHPLAARAHRRRS